jgi:hypothetical protein
MPTAEERAQRVRAVERYQKAGLELAESYTRSIPAVEL